MLGAVQPARAQCDGATDSKLLTTIYGGIKADKNLAPQISHINVVVINGAVKLQGWTETKRDYDKVVAIAVNTDCVRLVNVNNFESTPPAAGKGSGCASGTKPCGDICIPEGDTCNIMVEAKP
jgi:hypothetical protein